MTTKERILTAARELFNQHGTEPITTRHVAKELGMSHGNLCYHYPSREALITALYFQLVGEFDRQLGSMQGKPVSIRNLFNSLEQTFQVQHQYRFLMLDFAGIMRRIEPIRTHFRKLFEQRKLQLLFLLNQLVAQGLMQPELRPGQFGHYLTHFYILTDFWLAEAEILYQGPESEKVRHYVETFAFMLLPMLTEKGKADFEEVLKENYHLPNP